MRKDTEQGKAEEAESKAGRQASRRKLGAARGRKEQVSQWKADAESPESGNERRGKAGKERGAGREESAQNDRRRVAVGKRRVHNRQERRGECSRKEAHVRAC